MHPAQVFRLVALLAVSLLLCPSPVRADRVELDNGDRLSGQVLLMAEDALTLKTDYAGELKIPASRVRAIVTDSEAEVHLATGEVLKGRLEKTPDRGLVVAASSQRPAIAIDWAAVTAVNPPPPADPGWEGSITIGAGRQSGNTERSHLSLSGEGLRRLEKSRFSLGLQFNYAEENGEIDTRNTYGRFKYDYFLTEKFYWYLGVEMLKDKFKDLNLRTVIGPGVGYQVWDDKDRSLLFEGGLAYFSEDLKEGEDQHWVTARLATDMRFRLFEMLVFGERLVIYPSVEEFGEYQVRNEASLATPLKAGWSLKLSNILEYDSDPEPDVKKTDSNTQLGLQYAF